MNHLSTKIKSVFQNSVDLKTQILNDITLIEKIEQVTHLCVTTYQKDGKLLFCGNGGSASDAQHLAAELSGPFYLDREPLFAEALHVNASFMTATANDYDFTEVYARMIRAMGKKGDILFALSTSGNSPNILKAIKDAKKIGMIVIGMTGETGGKMKEQCDFLINVPSQDTPRIQEAHMMIGHVICELIEAAIFA